MKPASGKKGVQRALQGLCMDPGAAEKPHTPPSDPAPRSLCSLSGHGSCKAQPGQSPPQIVHPLPVRHAGEVPPHQLLPPDCVCGRPHA